MNNYITSKFFNSSVSFTENHSKAVLNFKKAYNPLCFGFNYCDALFPLIKKEYNRVKAIGIKDTYTDSEARAINNFFVFSVGSNTFALNNRLKYSFIYTDIINHTFNASVDYYVGTPDFCVPAHIQCVSSDISGKYFPLSIIIDAKPLNAEQMKKFVKLLTDYTFETFSIGFFKPREN